MKREGFRQRVAVLYPATRSCGICVVVVESNVARAWALGELPLPKLESTLSAFGPDVVLVPAHARAAATLSLPIYVTVRYYPQIKRRHPLPPHVRPIVGTLSKRAYSAALENLVVKGPYAVGSLDVVALTTSWLELHGRRKYGEAR